MVEQPAGIAKADGHGEEHQQLGAVTRIGKQDGWWLGWATTSSTPVMKMSSRARAAGLSASSSLRTCSMDMPRRNRK